MKIIFLDVDGVLNCLKYLANTTIVNMGIYKDLDKSKLELLKDVVQKTDAKLVLSFSWRESFTNDLKPTDSLAFSLVDALKVEKLSLYDKTP